MSKQEKTARTFMPEIIAPGTGLSPLTDKSVMPFNNVHTIWDVLTGKKYKLPGGGGDWSDGEDAQPGSYKDEGDQYKRRARDLDILKNLTNNPQEPKEVWKLKVKGGFKTFPSLESAQSYRRKMEEKGIFVSWIARTAKQEVGANHVDVAIGKTFMLEALNFSTNVKETGSCFCVAKGYFVTCAHVVMSYNKNTESSIDFSKYKGIVKVLINVDGKKVEAEVVDFDGAKDLAILKADIDSEPFAFDPHISIGEEVFAVGSPHGFENNTSFGHVSSTDKKIYFHPEAPMYMFVDLSILPGNSGGPIINRNTGKVIGVVTAIISDNDTYGLNAGVLASYVIELCERNGIKVERT
jgi:S1-C subfamily serine protease